MSRPFPHCCRKALALNPAAAAVHFNLGIVFMTCGQLDEAILCYRQAAALDPANAQAHYILGNVLKDQGKMAEAGDSFRQALRYQPQYADAHNNLGIILQSQGQPAEAAQCFREAMRINPTRADAYNNLGNALKDLGQLDQAIECYRQATHLPNPHHPDAYNNLGLVFKEQGQFAEGAQHFQQALNIDPGHKLALWNRCLLRLLQGDFDRGWQEFELRWQQPGMIPRTFQQPGWDGSPLEGKTILVYAEHGLGDTIQFMRYLPMVQARGGTVVFECQPALCRLLADIPGVDQFVAAGKPLPSFDVQASLLSLPNLFRTTLATIPRVNSYLAAEPKLVEYWRQELGRAARRKPAGEVIEPEHEFYVGIAWQGSLSYPGDRRSIPLSHFEALARVENVRLVSLQKGPRFRATLLHGKQFLNH